MENNDSVQLDKSLKVSWCNDRRGGSAGSAGAADRVGGRSSTSSSSSATGFEFNDASTAGGSVKSSSTRSSSVSFWGDLYAGGGDAIVPTELFAT